MLVPTGIAYFYDDPHQGNELSAFVYSILASIIGGTLLFVPFRRGLNNIGNQEGLVSVALAWIVLAFFGALPFALWEGEINGNTIGLTNAYFETMSGFTTTGATIISNIPDLPHGLLFWRSFTHWIGGMGIVVLWVAILPVLGPGSYQLFRAEMPGLSADRITPRIGATAKILWGIYLALTLCEVFLLWASPKMDLFNAVCHTFGTMATGGFSTQNASIAAFDSWYIEIVIIVFMVLAGCNFGLYHQLFTRGFKRVYRNTEIRFYFFLLLGATLLLTCSLQVEGIQNPEAHPNEAAKVTNLTQTIRTAAFQVVSITTTTGYCTADFDLWPDFCRGFLVMLMFFGGCAGSTGGGLKQIRIILLGKIALRELRRAIQPSAIFSIKVGGQTVDEKILSSIISLFLISIILLTGITLLMTALGLDLVTAFTSVIATMFNIGPGLATVGATQNYVFMPDTCKWILSMAMLLGRLEFVCVLAIFHPLLYRK